MKFWNRLRWTGAALFICIVLAVWLVHDQSTSTASGGAEPPPVPRIP
jgi:hypothetical protein